MIIGILFVVIYTLYMYFIGSVATNKRKSYSYQFLVGYMIYSFAVAVGGIIIQILNLPWLLFAIYMVIVIFGLAILAVMKCMRDGINIFERTKIVSFIKDQWFLIVVAIILVFMARINLTWIWGNNASDDGYYVSIVGSLPYSTFYTNPSTGMDVGLSGMGTYIVNTIYTEYSFFALITQIKATAFCRLYMAGFNYFLFGSCISCFAEFVMKQVYGEENVKSNLPQYGAAILLLFGAGMEYLATHYIYEIYDTWQFNTAMYYGSSIVRCMSVFFITLPFIDKDEITWKDVILVACIGVGLVSKSTIALPLIIVVSVAYLLSYWLLSPELTHKVFAAVLVLLYFAVGIVLGDHETFHTLIMEYVAKNLQSIMFWPCLALFIGSFVYRNKYILRFNVMLVIMLLLMIIPPFDNIFETASVMKFVAARAFSTWIYTFIAINFVYFLTDVFFFVKYESSRQTLVMTLSVLLVIQIVYGYNQSIDSFLYKVNVAHSNASAVPESTVILGDLLEERYNETGQTNVALCVDMTEPNGYAHYPSTLIRAFSPHTVSLSAVPRFGAQSEGEYAAFTKESQDVFNTFIGNPTDDTYNALATIMDTVGTNVIVTNSEVGLNNYSYITFLQRGGFTLYKIIDDEDANLEYFVYTRSLY